MSTPLDNSILLWAWLFRLLLAGGIEKEIEECMKKREASQTSQ